MNRKSIIFLVILLIGTQVTIAKEVICDTWTRGDRCFTTLPYCKRYEFVQSQQDQTYTFSCLECEFGFEPLQGGIPKLSLDSSGELPTLEQGIKSLEVCIRSPQIKSEEIQNCNHPQCWYELPECYRYRVEPIQDLDESYKYGRFTCLDCTDTFEVVEDGVYGLLNTTAPKLACRRKEEIRECGPFCKSEFPGCQQYKIKGVYRVKSESDYAENELAQFICLMAEPLYEAYMRLNVAETSTKITKYLALRDYNTPMIQCMDRVCLHVFPKCKEYYSVVSAGNSFTYYCKTCNQGYEPVKEGITDSTDIDGLWSSKRALELCRIQEVQNSDCGEDCQVEIPGCLKYSVYDSYLEDNGQQAARYRCDLCKPELESLGDVSNVLVSAGWGISDNQKVRCAPKAMTQNELPCDDECKKYMPHCLAYKYDKYEEQIIYKCTMCENEFFPNPDPQEFPWYARQSIQACLKSPTGGSIDCQGPCKQMFPHCKTLTVTTNPNDKTDTYACNQCEEGFSPIQYLPLTPGVLSEQAHFMLRYNQIYLCSDNQHHLYLSKDDCTEANNFYESEHCALASNCKSLVRFRHIVTGRIGYKCEECLDGFKPKQNLPKLYDMDQTLCRPTGESSQVKERPVVWSAN
jgi:hypothetical protein